MKTIYLVPNEEKDRNLDFTRRVAALSKGRARLLLSERFRDFAVEGAELVSEEIAHREADVVFALGGDGTLLSVAHDVIGSGQPILGFNLGRLGFLAEVEQKETESCLDKFFSGDYVVEDRMMLRAQIEEGETKRTLDALNDVVLFRGGSIHLLEMDVCVDGEFVDDYKSDGLIISTPTGSTAYSMSAGGPIVDPSVDSMLITPICPHKMYSRAVLVPASKTISATMKDGRADSAMISGDGREETVFTRKSRITITKSPYTTRLVRVSGAGFYSVLRHKLAGKDN